MDASRRRFLIGAGAAIVAAQMPAMASAHPMTATEVTRLQSEYVARIQRAFVRALERAMNPPHILYADGTTKAMPSDQSWRTADALYRQMKEVE